MIMTIELTDQADLIDKLEALSFEVESRKEIISHLINTDQIYSEGFKHYDAEYREFYVKYSLLKQELEQAIVTKYSNYKIINWSLTFATKQVIIEYEEI